MRDIASQSHQGAVVSTAIISVPTITTIGIVMSMAYFLRTNIGLRGRGDEVEKQ